MKIAFRYENLPSRFLKDVDAEDFTSNQKFDYGTYLDQSLIDKSNIEFYSHSDILRVLYEKTKTKLTDNKSVCRILIDELGSPLSPISTVSLPSLIHHIKVLMRRLANSVCLATLVSTDIYDVSNDLLETVRDQIHFDVDSVVRFIAFDMEHDSDNPYSTDYQGLLHLLRFPRLNSFEPYNSSLDTTEFGLKLLKGKRYLTVDKLALPPDLGETVNRFTSSVNVSDGLSCGSAHKLASFLN